MIWKTTIVTFILAFLTLSIQAQTVTDLNYEDLGSCNQNNFYVTSVEFRDSNGNVISPEYDTEIGTEIQGQIFATFGGSTTNAYQLVAFYELYVNGELSQKVITDCQQQTEAFELGIPIYLGDFVWNYGDELEIKNIFLRWNTGGNKANCPSIPGSGAQCNKNPDGFLVRTPLVPNFTYTQNCNNYKVTFENLTTGGNPDGYSFSWSYEGEVFSTKENPTFDFESAGENNEVSLTVSYYNDRTGKNITKTYTKTVNVFEPVVADAPVDVKACDSYTLPALSVGNYFTGSQGTGTAYSAGDEITADVTLYVYAVNSENTDCYDENSFSIDISETPVADAPVDVKACDTYTLPALSVGNYFTGSQGTGTAYSAGDEITADVTLYVYAVNSENTDCYDENSFSIDISETPVADAPVDVKACDSYTLPALSVGNYFTGSQGTGTAYSAGDEITADVTLYVYAVNSENTDCYDENSFSIDISETPVADAPVDVKACDSYTLPALSDGNYFTGSQGTGTAYSAGDEITADVTLYVYAVNSENTDCYDENSFSIDISETPVADAPVDVKACDSYTLPALSVGNYFTGSQGTGTAYSAGDEITADVTLYVYAVNSENTDCYDENSFSIDISETPVADAPVDVKACDTYTLPALSVGNYFTGSQGTGTAYSAGDEITADVTLYVYAVNSENTDCYDENSFSIDISETPVADAPVDVKACDSYTLPALSVGNYFTGSQGTGTAYSAGDEITADVTLYVYAVNSENTDCYDENSFSIDISETPVADAPVDVKACDSYTLPALSVGNYFTGSQGTGTAYSAGDEITADVTLYVYAVNSENTDCYDENSFSIDISETPVADAPVDVKACDSYTLPALSVGNYFTGSQGTGTAYSAGDEITADVTLYVYAVNSENTDCYDENSFSIDISETPVADAPVDVKACDSYTLPALSVGNYFTGSQGTGTAYSAGDEITADVTLYVYAVNSENTDCYDENSFSIDISETPVADAPVDVKACDTYTLPALSVGNYFTGSQGTGTAYSAGDEITADVTLYVYAVNSENTDCYDENSFSIDISETPVADAPVDVKACDILYTSGPFCW